MISAPYFLFLLRFPSFKLEGIITTSSYLAFISVVIIFNILCIDTLCRLVLLSLTAFSIISIFSKPLLLLHLQFFQNLILPINFLLLLQLSFNLPFLLEEVNILSQEVISKLDLLKLLLELYLLSFILSAIWVVLHCHLSKL